MASAKQAEPDELEQKLIKLFDGWVELEPTETGDRWQFNGEHADTPEDALCKLAIELFKQGILTPRSERADKAGDE